MIEEIRKIKSGKRELRQFGVTMGIVLTLLGALLLWRGKEYYRYLFVLSPMFISLGLVLPILLKPIHKIWMSLALAIGWVMTRVILTILFYLVLTPVGILARLFGKDFLNLRLNQSVDTYWIRKDVSKIDKKSYENQF